MFDTISEISIDSISQYLKRDLDVQISDHVSGGASTFEFVPTDSTQLFFDVDTTAATASVEQMLQGFSGTVMPFSQIMQSMFFLLFVLCFVILAFCFNREGFTLAANFKNIFTGGTRSRSAFKEQITITGVWSEVFLIFQAILISTIVFFTYSWNQGIAELRTDSMIFLFLAISLGVLLLVGVKYLIYRLTDYVFAEWGISEWAVRYFRILELSGILIFIPALFFVFVPECRHIALFLLTIVFFIMTLLVFWNLLNIFAKNKVGLLNYFLYLCAIEIMPYFLIYKVVISFVNIAGN